MDKFVRLFNTVVFVAFLLFVLYAMFCMAGCSTVNTNIPADSVQLTTPTSFEGQKSWQTLETSMENSKTDVVLKLQGIGGDTDQLSQFTDVMQDVENKGHRVHVVVTGYAISSHAVAVCYATDYSMQVTGVLVYHNAVTVETGEYNDVLTRQLDSKCVQKDVISTTEVDRTIERRERIEISADGTRTFYPDYNEK